MPVIFICCYLINRGINSLLEPGSLIFYLLVILPLLMMGLPLLAFWYLNNRCTPATAQLTQQFLRASAGPEELLVRELSNMRGPINRDQIEPTSSNHSRR